MIASRLGLVPALVIWMVKKRLVIRALERPAECREEGAEGERMDHGWVDSDDSDCFDIVLFFSTFAGLGVLIEGNSSSGEGARAAERCLIWG